MVKFEAVVSGKVVAEASTMSEAIEKAVEQGYIREEIQVRSVRGAPRV